MRSPPQPLKSRTCTRSTSESLPQSQPLGHAVQVAARHTQRPCRRGPITCVLFHGAKDHGAFGLFERLPQSHTPYGDDDRALARRWARGLQLPWFGAGSLKLEVLKSEQNRCIACGVDTGAQDGPAKKVIELAHVARPFSGCQCVPGRLVEPYGSQAEPPSIHIQEKAGEQRNVRTPFAKRRHVNRIHVQAMKQVRAEAAGLHLLFDRYRYTYSPGGTTGPVDSPVEISCEVRGTVIPPVIGLPHLSSRDGTDMAPVDMGNDDAVLWLRALVWPEEQARMERLEAALSLARRAPPAVSEGDALALLPKLVEEIDREAVPVIYHSHVLAHMPEGVRRTFTGTVLPGLGASRDLAWLACEGSTMELTTWVAGVREGRRLAKRDPHGEWIEWLAE